MAPFLKSVFNGSGKKVHVSIDDKSFHIGNDESIAIETSITTDGYSKIDKVNPEDVHGYRLRYENYNIKINDALGRLNGIEDFPVHTKWSDQDVRIDVLENKMHISANDLYLGIYQPDGNPKYYRSVVVIHNTGGGVTVKGGEINLAGAEEVKEKEDEVEVEETSASKEVPNA